MQNRGCFIWKANFQLSSILSLSGVRKKIERNGRTQRHFRGAAEGESVSCALIPDEGRYASLDLLGAWKETLLLQCTSLRHSRAEALGCLDLPDESDEGWKAPYLHQEGLLCTSKDRRKESLCLVPICKGQTGKAQPEKEPGELDST